MAQSETVMCAKEEVARSLQECATEKEDVGVCTSIICIVSVPVTVSYDTEKSDAASELILVFEQRGRSPARGEEVQ